MNSTLRLVIWMSFIFMGFDLGLMMHTLTGG